MVARQQGDQQAGRHGEHPGCRDHPPFRLGHVRRVHHGHGEGRGVGRGEAPREQQLAPAEQEAERRRDHDAGSDGRQQDGGEEAREAVALQAGGLVDLARHAGYVALEQPHGDRQIEQKMSHGHGDMGVEQREGATDLVEREHEHGGRRQAVEQQPGEWNVESTRWHQVG